jgi:hypothetical protein
LQRIYKEIEYVKQPKVLKNIGCHPNIELKKKQTVGLKEYAGNTINGVIYTVFFPAFYQP